MKKGGLKAFMEKANQFKIEDLSNSIKGGLEGYCHPTGFWDDRKIINERNELKPLGEVDPKDINILIKK